VSGSLDKGLTGAEVAWVKGENVLCQTLAYPIRHHPPHRGGGSKPNTGRVPSARTAIIEQQDVTTGVASA